MTSEKFERHVRQYKDAVYRQMVRVCAHREDAEDALAKALLLAFQASAQLGSDESFRSWLGTIAKRVCTRMRSHPKIQQAYDFALENQLVSDGISEFDFQVLKGCILEAVEGLPEIYRDVYTATEIEGHTVPEAAKRFRLSVSATKSRLHRARSLVRERLDGSICAQ